MRTLVGLSWGVDDLNRVSQPIQDSILMSLQLEKYLGGISEYENSISLRVRYNPKSFDDAFAAEFH
jgi:hypothetical protein